MFQRKLINKLKNALNNMPATALLGPRQVGKTTLALQIAQSFEKESIYLDLELTSDLAKLSDAESYLRRFENKLLIIDEIQRKPDLFPLLRALIDIRKRKGEKSAQFLLLGSASRDLLQHSSETLAGRIRFLELTPFNALEIYNNNPQKFNYEKLWIRGGFPDSYLAIDENQSRNWRSDFIASYVERDIPLMGPQISILTMRRLWSMLAHSHGTQVNFSNLAKSLSVSYKTVKNYIDILTDFYMVRQLQPWQKNIKKRLVKSPKIYLRDSGIMHQLLNIADYETLLGHPIIGNSWEGFVIENIITALPENWHYNYYRSSAGAEIDLIIETAKGKIWAIEIKLSSAPKPSKGFHIAADDIKADEKFVIYPGTESFPIADNTEAIGLIEFLHKFNSHITKTDS